VLTFPRAKDLKTGIATVHEHLKKKQTELNPMLKIEPVLDRKTGKPAIAQEVGSFRGQVDRLRFILSPEIERYYVVGVTNRADGLLAVVCDCRWERRDYWEQEFRAIMDSIRPAEKSKSGSPSPPKAKEKEPTEKEKETPPQSPAKKPDDS
jgi:hypothetical protein